MPNLSTMDYPMETGVLVKWYKREGDAVRNGEPLFSVETSKVTVDVEAPQSGTLRKVLAPEGSEVPIGQAVAIIE